MISNNLERYRRGGNRPDIPGHFAIPAFVSRASHLDFCLARFGRNPADGPKFEGVAGKLAVSAQIARSTERMAFSIRCYWIRPPSLARQNSAAAQISETVVHERLVAPLDLVVSDDKRRQIFAVELPPDRHGLYVQVRNPQ